MKWCWVPRGFRWCKGRVRPEKAVQLPEPDLRAQVVVDEVVDETGSRVSTLREQLDHLDGLLASLERKT